MDLENITSEPAFSMPDFFLDTLLGDAVRDSCLFLVKFDYACRGKIGQAINQLANYNEGEIDKGEVRFDTLTEFSEGLIGLSLIYCPKDRAEKYITLLKKAFGDLGVKAEIGYYKSVGLLKFP